MLIHYGIMTPYNIVGISADDIDNLKNISYMDNEQVYYDTVVGRYPEAVQLK